MLSALKTLFKPRLTHPDTPPVDLREFDRSPENIEAIFGDLPRMINPAGVDDTDKIRKRVMDAYPYQPYLPDPTVNRRKLYMAIYKLRTETKRGWVADDHVKRLVVQEGVLVG